MNIAFLLFTDGRKRGTAPRSDKGAPQREPHDTLPLSPEPAAEVVGPGVFLCWMVPLLLSPISIDKNHFCLLSNFSNSP